MERPPARVRAHCQVMGSNQRLDRVIARGLYLQGFASFQNVIWITPVFTSGQHTETGVGKKTGTFLHLKKQLNFFWLLPAFFLQLPFSFLNE